jgi:Ca2+-binding EF-hand superfamily protein/predicted nucleotidyltransferase
MYIFLNNKYGLKNLVLDWASAIINAIKLYSNEDCEINLFGKILRNEQEENSRLILIKLKENIAELLEYYYKSKYPLKSKEEIDNIMNQKKNGILLEEEWKGIIYYIYNAEDSQIIENKILDFIQEQNNKIFFIIENGEDVNNDRFVTYQNNNRNNTTEKTNLSKKLNTNMTDVFLTEKKRVTRQDLNNINRLKEEVNIPYSDFIQLVCENQIQNRQKYLKKFVKLFRKFDKDGDGVLNEEQFIGMIKAIPYCQNNIEEYIDKFLAIIDPFNHKKFTFNNCVTLLSSEIIDENQISQSYYNQALLNVDSPNIGLNIQNETTLLDKICLGT